MERILFNSISYKETDSYDDFQETNQIIQDLIKRLDDINDKISFIREEDVDREIISIKNEVDNLLRSAQQMLYQIDKRIQKALAMKL